MVTPLQKLHQNAHRMQYEAAGAILRAGATFAPAVAAHVASFLHFTLFADPIVAHTLRACRLVAAVRADESRSIPTPKTKAGAKEEWLRRPTHTAATQLLEPQ
jgi:hypothetical protein